MAEVKFPFTPNETTKAAFRREGALRAMTIIITEALLESSARFAENPWRVLAKEHPDVNEASSALVYNALTEKVDLKSN